VKESDDDRTRLNRVISTLQDQFDKSKKLNMETKSKLDTTEVELNSLRKECEQTKRQTKKQQQDQTQTDTKLNRALEEAERYKQQLTKMQQTTKDVAEQDKKKIEQLTNDNRRLEKQRLELMNAFKRQLKLIDILKKQKVNICLLFHWFDTIDMFSFILKHRKCFNLPKKNSVKQSNGMHPDVFIRSFVVLLCVFLLLCLRLFLSFVVKITRFCFNYCLFDCYSNNYH
jgi:hypothetical protein